MLTREDIEALYDAVITAGVATHRIALFAGMESHMAHISTAPTPDAQILLDLTWLNSVAEVSDDPVPLQRWLANAHTLLGKNLATKPQGDVIRRIRDGLPGCGGLLARTTSARRKMTSGLFWVLLLMGALLTVGVVLSERVPAVLSAMRAIVALVPRSVTYAGSAILGLGWLVWVVALVRSKPPAADWIPPSARRAHTWRRAILSGLLLVIAALGLGVPVVAAPKLSLICPQAIQSHEATIAGTAAPGSRIALYVHPDDNSSDFWLQGGGKIPVGRDGDWRYVARFGNPFGIDHREPWANYQVYALALAEKADAPDGESIRASPVAVQCSLKREPELAISCQPDALEIVSPKPHACPFAAGVLADPSCNPQAIASVESPVTFSWRGRIPQDDNMPVHVELYREGRPVQDQSLPDGLVHKLGKPIAVKGDLVVPLAPGEYELKIAKHWGSPCKTSVWFLVHS